MNVTGAGAPCAVAPAAGPGAIRAASRRALCMSLPSLDGDRDLSPGERVGGGLCDVVVLLRAGRAADAEGAHDLALDDERHAALERHHLAHRGQRDATILDRVLEHPRRAAE